MPETKLVQVRNCGGRRSIAGKKIAPGEIFDYPAHQVAQLGGCVIVESTPAKPVTQPTPKATNG